MQLRFLAEASVYRSTGQYRSSWIGQGRVSGITPSLDLPPGTYQQTCVNCDYFQGYNGHVLSCDCLDLSGQYRPALLRPVESCAGQDIANCNGQFNCGGCGF